MIFLGTVDFPIAGLGGWTNVLATYLQKSAIIVRFANALGCVMCS